MAKISVILKAWLNVYKGLTTVEHKRKANICKGCPSRKYSKHLDFINDELIDVKGFVCSECGCPLIAKIRSTDDCPKNKW